MLKKKWNFIHSYQKMRSQKKNDTENLGKNGKLQKSKKTKIWVK